MFSGRPVTDLSSSVMGILGPMVLLKLDRAQGLFGAAGPIFDKRVEGDGLSSVFFFLSGIISSLKNLKKLAKHVIRMGNKLNPEGIRGLEMDVWCEAWQVDSGFPK